jgi:hypothetical protein
LGLGCRGGEGGSGSRSRPGASAIADERVVFGGLPLAYEVLPGNTANRTTLRMFLARIEQYGRARRIWVMGRGILTEAVLAEMRASDPPVRYLVGTPKGRLSRLEKQAPRQALAGSPPGCRGQAAGRGRRTLRVRNCRARSARSARCAGGSRSGCETWPRCKSRARKC